MKKIQKLNRFGGSKAAFLREKSKIDFPDKERGQRRGQR
jgi:hypothetical protein